MNKKILAIIGIVAVACIIIISLFFILQQKTQEEKIDLTGHIEIGLGKAAHMYSGYRLTNISTVGEYEVQNIMIGEITGYNLADFEGKEVKIIGTIKTVEYEEEWPPTQVSGITHALFIIESIEKLN